MIETTPPIEWLLNGPPWAAYRTRIDLLGQPETDDHVQADRSAMLAHAQVRRLIANVAEWPGQIVNTHRKADLLMHQLVFLADLGLTVADDGIAPVCEKIIAGQSSQGPFMVMVNVPPSIGGKGVDNLSWASCDYSLSLYALLKFGLAGHPAVQRALEFHLEQISEVGYRCCLDDSYGSFRPPGKKSDPCPDATLVGLKVLSAAPGDYAQQAQPAVDCLLNLWQERLTRHPYIFYMGNDFCKLKAPFIWYDILHVTEVLSHWPSALSHPAMIEMAGIIATKADPEGRFTPESIYQWWKDWDFGQKKTPSPWLTLVAQRIIHKTG